MNACRTASLVAFGALFVGGGVGACREATQGSVPPVTTAQPTPSAPVLSGPVTDPSLTTRPPAPIPTEAGATTAQATPVRAEIRDLPAKVDTSSGCTEAVVAVVSGSAAAQGETLGAGDVLVMRHAEPFEVKGTGTVVTAVASLPSESCQQKRPPAKSVVRVTSTPEVTWARGAMHARLQVGEKQSSPFYLGRLEGTSPVGEHVHKGTWEILAAIDAAGTFVLDGKEARLGPRQVVAVPPDTKHEWRPDPGSKLLAVQMYSPPGPEQRFLALAAAEKDGGTAEAGAPTTKP